ncbi:hypothetical protein ABPG77_001107 [Micractinium sp. CCAP 211/92]
MAAATDGAPSGEQLFTRGGPNVPDNRGQSMVAKHMEKQQKEKETRAMERLHLLLPALGPTVRAVALQECNWDEERALTMLRRFQVAKTDELSKLHKERRRHQLHLQSGKPERRRKDKDKDKKKKRQRDEEDSSGSSDSGSGSEEEPSGSSGGSGSESSGGSEDERGRARSGGKKGRGSDSRSRSPKRSRKEKKERKRGSKDKEKKRRKEKERRGKKEKKERRKDKAKVKQDKGKQGAIGQDYGKYGIIRETDLYSKRPEFQLWAIEVKNIDLEAMPRSEEKELFKDFMEEYNTATLPHKKFYDLELYEKQQAAKAVRKGTKLETEERLVFDDEAERKKELAAERARQQQERLKQAYEELKTTDKAKDMREQQLLRSQLDLAYKMGDRAKAEKLAALLAPTALADIGKVVRPPASGT